MRKTTKAFCRSKWAYELDLVWYLLVTKAHKFSMGFTSLTPSDGFKELDSKWWTKLITFWLDREGMCLVGVLEYRQMRIWFSTQWKSAWKGHSWPAFDKKEIKRHNDVERKMHISSFFVSFSWFFLFPVRNN